MYRSICMYVLFALPAMADLAGIPTYRYFYTCDSGVVDCVNFDRNHNYFGDYGMSGVVPANWPDGVDGGGLWVAVSNHKGEVFGLVFSETGHGLAYGYGGQVVCVGGLRFDCTDLDWAAIGINDNGLYVFDTGHGPCIGFGFDGIADLGGCDIAEYSVLDVPNFPKYSLVYALGINDENQVLATVELCTFDGCAPGGPITGVFSPTPVPEPSLPGVLAAILSACIVLARRKERNRRRVGEVL